MTVSTLFLALSNKTATASRRKAEPFGQSYTVALAGSLNMMLIMRVDGPKSLSPFNAVTACWISVALSGSRG